MLYRPVDALNRDILLWQELFFQKNPFKTVWLSKICISISKEKVLLSKFSSVSMWVQDQVKKLKEIRKVLLSLTRKNHRQRISVTSVRCVWVSRTNLNGSFRLDSHYRNSYGFGLYCSPFVRIIYCCKVSKAYVTRSPIQSPNTNKQPSAQGLEGKHSSPFPEERSHFLKFWCSVLIYVSWLRKMDWPKNTCLIQLTTPTCIWKKWQSWWPPSPY